MDDVVMDVVGIKVVFDMRGGQCSKLPRKVFTDGEHYYVKIKREFIKVVQRKSNPEHFNII
jgi:hypothetical protein